MKNVTILLAVVALLALAGQAQGADLTYWQGPTGTPSSQDWTTAGNWTDGVPSYDTAPQYGLFNDWTSESNTCKITSGTLADPVSVLQLIIGNVDGVGKVDMSEGYLYTKYIYAGTSTNDEDTATGTFIQRGGTVVVRYEMRLGRKTGVTGTYEFRGGTFDGVTGGPGTPSAGRVKVSRQGGTGILYIGTATGTFKCLEYIQGEEDGHGTLKFDIGADGIDGATKVEVTNAATLADDLVITNQVTLGQDHYVLMTYGSRGGTTFDNVVAPSGWSVLYDQGAGSNELWLVPEPATMTLLGIGGLGVLIRRRRK